MNEGYTEAVMVAAALVCTFYPVSMILGGFRRAALNLAVSRSKLARRMGRCGERAALIGWAMGELSGWGGGRVWAMRRCAYRALQRVDGVFGQD